VKKSGCARAHSCRWEGKWSWNVGMVESWVGLIFGITVLLLKTCGFLMRDTNSQRYVTRDMSHGRWGLDKSKSMRIRGSDCLSPMGISRKPHLRGWNPSLSSQDSYLNGSWCRFCWYKKFS
jgi:hypothetical protein